MYIPKPQTVTLRGYEFLPSLVVSLLATWAVMCACTLLAIQRKPKAGGKNKEEGKGLRV